MRTRNAHQAFLMALHVLKKTAWNEFQETDNSGKTYHEWNKEVSDKAPTFFFWNMIANLTKRILMFVRAHRQGNLILYMQTLKELVPFFLH